MQMFSSAMNYVFGDKKDGFDPMRKTTMLKDFINKNFSQETNMDTIVDSNVEPSASKSPRSQIFGNLMNRSAVWTPAEIFPDVSTYRRMELLLVFLDLDKLAKQYLLCLYPFTADLESNGFDRLSSFLQKTIPSAIGWALTKDKSTTFASNANIKSYLTKQWFGDSNPSMPQNQFLTFVQDLWENDSAFRARVLKERTRVVQRFSMQDPASTTWTSWISAGPDEPFELQGHSTEEQYAGECNLAFDGRVCKPDYFLGRDDKSAPCCFPKSALKRAQNTINLALEGYSAFDKVLHLVRNKIINAKLDDPDSRKKVFRDLRLIKLRSQLCMRDIRHLPNRYLDNRADPLGPYSCTDAPDEVASLKHDLLQVLEMLDIQKTPALAVEDQKQRFRRALTTLNEFYKSDLKAACDWIVCHHNDPTAAEMLARGLAFFRMNRLRSVLDNLSLSVPDDDFLQVARNGLADTELENKLAYRFSKTRPVYTAAANDVLQTALDQLWIPHDTTNEKALEESLNLTGGTPLLSDKKKKNLTDFCLPRSLHLNDNLLAVAFVVCFLVGFRPAQLTPDDEAWLRKDTHQKDTASVNNDSYVLYTRCRQRFCKGPEGACQDEAKFQDCKANATRKWPEIGW